MDLEKAFNLTRSEDLYMAAVRAETHRCRIEDVNRLYMLYYAAQDREQRAKYARKRALSPA